MHRTVFGSHGDGKTQTSSSVSAAPDGGREPHADEWKEPTPAGEAPGDRQGDVHAHADGCGDALARAITEVLGGVMREFDARAEAAAGSQNALALSLDRLTGELDKLLEDAPLPFIMQHAARISGIRKRVFALNSMLKLIQRRIDNIDMMLSAGASHEKSSSNIIGQQT